MFEVFPKRIMKHLQRSHVKLQLFHIVPFFKAKSIKK